MEPWGQNMMTENLIDDLIVDSPDSDNLNQKWIPFKGQNVCQSGIDTAWCYHWISSTRRKGAWCCSLGHIKKGHSRPQGYQLYVPSEMENETSRKKSFKWNAILQIYQDIFNKNKYHKIFQIYQRGWLEKEKTWCYVTNRWQSKTMWNLVVLPLSTILPVPLTQIIFNEWLNRCSLAFFAFNGIDYNQLTENTK